MIFHIPKLGLFDLWFLYCIDIFHCQNRIPYKRLRICWAFTFRKLISVGCSSMHEGRWCRLGKWKKLLLSSACCVFLHNLLVSQLLKRLSWGAAAMAQDPILEQQGWGTLTFSAIPVLAFLSIKALRIHWKNRFSEGGHSPVSKNPTFWKSLIILII